jgi:hypothetical protein
MSHGAYPRTRFEPGHARERLQPSAGGHIDGTDAQSPGEKSSQPGPVLLLEVRNECLLRGRPPFVPPRVYLPQE